MTCQHRPGGFETLATNSMACTGGLEGSAADTWARHLCTSSGRITFMHITAVAEHRTAAARRRPDHTAVCLGPGRPVPTPAAARARTRCGAVYTLACCAYLVDDHNQCRPAGQLLAPYALHGSGCQRLRSGLSGTLRAPRVAYLIVWCVCVHTTRGAVVQTPMHAERRRLSPSGAKGSPKGAMQVRAVLVAA
jgi:hypothetical protein